MMMMMMMMMIVDNRINSEAFAYAGA